MVSRLLSRTSPNLGLFYYELMVQPITDKPLIMGRLARLVETREIKQADPEIEFMPVRPEILESRFKQNAICIGGFQKGKFIGYIWFCFRGYEEDEVRCRFVLTPEAESVFDFDLYIFPEHRLGLGFLGIWDGASRFLRSHGIRFSFSRLTRFNLASRRAHEHLGWKRAGSALFFKAWRMQVMVATVFPYLHLSLRNSGRPQLRLHADALQRHVSMVKSL